MIDGLISILKRVKAYGKMGYLGFSYILLLCMCLLVMTYMLVVEFSGFSTEYFYILLIALGIYGITYMTIRRRDAKTTVVFFNGFLIPTLSLVLFIQYADIVISITSKPSFDLSLLMTVLVAFCFIYCFTVFVRSIVRNGIYRYGSMIDEVLFGIFCLSTLGSYIYVLFNLLTEVDGVWLIILVVVLVFPLIFLSIFSWSLLVVNFKKKSSRCIGLGLLVSAIIFVPKYYAQHEYNKVMGQINLHGYTYEGYKGINYRALSHAYLSKLNSNESVKEGVFNGLFDTTPQAYYGDKLKGRKRITNTRTNATNASQVGKYASVVVDLSEVHTEVIDGNEGAIALTTEYSFHLTNSSNINQEVIMHFQAPSAYSVVSDLTLGLNKELKGQVAPRGAAKKVYANALRNNTDPALLEKLGIRTYSLRVFPIPALNHPTLRGRQLVTFSITTPLERDTQNIIQTPSFKLINAKFDDGSDFLMKVQRKNTLLFEKNLQGQEISKYLSKNSVIEEVVIQDSSSKTFFDYCLPRDTMRSMGGSDVLKNLEKYYSLDYENKKTAVFFDISRSVARQDENVSYRQIFDSIKQKVGNTHSIDLYTANHQVEKIGSFDDLEFWGYTEQGVILSYIEKMGFENTRIIIITDDDSYNYSTQEDPTRNIQSLVSNQISVLKVGSEVKTFRHDFNTILASTRGDIYEINDLDDLEESVTKIFDTDVLKFKTLSECESDSVPTDDRIQKIVGGYVGGLLLGVIKDTESRNTIADTQTTIAEKLGIVNQFNSLIALESTQQQNQLDSFKNQGDKYNSKYDNLNSGDALGSNGNNRVVRTGQPSMGGGGGGFMSPNNAFAPSSAGGNSEMIDIVGAGSSQQDSSMGVFRGFLSWLPVLLIVLFTYCMKYSLIYTVIVGDDEEVLE